MSTSSNRTAEVIGYPLAYDQENRLTGVSGVATASFLWDADGPRVKDTVGGVTTA